MERPESSQNNWCGLPNEIRRKIVSGFGKKDRLALRICSRRDYQLIKSIPFRCLFKLQIESTHDRKWRFSIKKSEYGVLGETIFSTFEGLQQKLSEEIEKHDYIKTCHISLQGAPTAFKLSKSNGSQMKINLLELGGGKNHVVDILKQVQVDHSNAFCIGMDDVDNAVFDMKQIIQADVLFVMTNSIRLDQLLELKASSIIMGVSQNIKLEDINKFLQKRLLLLEDGRKIHFKIEHATPILSFTEILKDLHCEAEVEEETPENGKAKLITTFRHDLEVSYHGKIFEAKSIDSNRREEVEKSADVEGEIYRDKFTLKRIEFISIEIKNSQYVLKVGENKNCFSLADDLQTKLGETLENFNYVYRLEIKNTNYNWKLGTNRKRLAVAILKLVNATNITEAVKQIETIHLKEVWLERYMYDTKSKMLEAEGNVQDQELFEMQQIVDARKLKVVNCHVTEAQFTKLNTVKLNFVGKDGWTPPEYTNGFLKKCVANLNLEEYNFDIRSFTSEDPVRLFAGLEIFSEKSNPLKSIFIINSPHPEYQMLVELEGVNITGKRIERKVENIQGTSTQYI